MEYTFHSVQSMLGIVNDPSKVPKAAERPLYTAAEGMDAGQKIMAQMPDGSSDFLAEVDTHKVVFNESDPGQIFGVVTDEYEIIQAPQFFGPLAAELSERDMDPDGRIIMSDGGATGYAEVLTGDGIWPVDRDGKQNPVRAGLTVRWSHDGGVSVRASGFAQDGQCSNTMRQVSDSIYVKHAGDVSERVDFETEWSNVLDQLGAFSNALENVINEAYSHSLWDFDTHTFGDEWLDATDRLEKLSDEEPPAFLSENARDGLAGFFDLLGFPRYLAYSATVRAMWRLVQKANDRQGQSPTVLTAWDAYSALTYALTHEARFDAGSSSDDDYHRTASDLLHNPEKAMQDAQMALSQRVGEAEAEGGLLIESDEGDAMRAYKEQSEQLRQALQSGD